ncbi:MAG: class I SAM-dependent methyltransferase [Candidatus Micrarchaeota archaeon]|nr:class I SAM-dependent methyltransferase [Candidatus Micrarchaeota archaeon]MDE1849696.1 class I SAM-dependent methyltransferase [Candidatus Micrarchaeota archaeon]
MDNDTQGHLIWNYYKGLLNFKVVERSDGYVNVDAGAKSYFSDYNDWAKHEKEAIGYAKGRFLDIGCGAGRVGLHLQKRGFGGLSIDTSPLAIKVCRLRGVKNARLMGIEDIPKLGKGSFDSIIMFGNNFGLLGGFNKAKTLLKEMYRITSDKGTIIAETRDPYITDNLVHFVYHKANANKGRMPGQLRIRIRFMQYCTDWYDYLYVSRNEMKQILKGTGWKAVRFINDPRYWANGEYIAIIRKDTNAVK